MPPITVAARAPSLALREVPAELPARPGVRVSGSRRWWARILFWPAELIRLVALIYMLPIVIYAIGTPIAVAVNVALFCAGWSWKELWQ